MESTTPLRHCKNNAATGAQSCPQGSEQKHHCYLCLTYLTKIIKKKGQRVEIKELLRSSFLV